MTTTKYARTRATITADAAKGQDVDWLASDFSMTFSSTFARISVAVSSAVKVKLVPSSGTALYLNNGSALVADSVHTEDVVLDTARTWNLATDDAGGTTVRYLAVLETEA